MSDQPECPHKEHTLDRRTGYTCDACGISLVFCWKCAIAGLSHNVHMYPECDDTCTPARGMFFGNKGRAQGNGADNR